MREGLTRPLWLALVIAAFCAPLFIGLNRTDVESDEAIYSFAVDEILINGDWLNPRSSPDANAIFLEKPPLKFWIVAAPIRLGLLPPNELGLRVWDALFGAIAFLYVFALGRRLGGPVCGVVAVMVLFVHVALVFDHGIRGNNMEGPLFLCYCGGIYHFIAWGSEPAAGRRRRHILTIAAYFFLGFMTKFVAAFFLPIVMVASALTLPQTRGRIKEDWRAWLAATAMFLVLAAPWFVYESIREGKLFWQIIFGTHVLMRFTSGLDPSHLHPWNYYFVLIWRDLQHANVGWLAVVGGAIAVVGAVRDRRFEMITVLAWLILPLTLMSVGRSKLPHYAYPFLPPFALLVGLGPGWLIQAGRGYLDAAVNTIGGWFSGDQPWTIVVRRLLIGLTMVAVGIAAATLVLGNLNWKIGGVQILRNSHVMRPLIFAMLFAILAGRRSVATRFLFPAVVLLAVLPVNSYEDTLKRLRVEEHPLRTARDCLVPVWERERQAGRQAAGVLSIGEKRWFLHNYFYYLRHAGGWESVETLDPAAVSSALFEPGRQRLVLIPDDDYRAFRASHGPELAEIPALPLRNVLLLMPGPYAACGPGASARSLALR